MLELTLTTGTELIIREEIRIVFRGDVTSGGVKAAGVWAANNEW